MNAAGLEQSCAVFLDRDGTLIEDRGHLRSPDGVVFFPDTIPALRRLQERFLLFIVTDQSGVGKGLITPDEAKRVNQFVVNRLRESGISITGVYCCPHRREDDCRCIKPNPFSLLLAAGEHGVNLRHSFVVGDHPHDAELAVNANATGLYVLTGHGERHRGDLRPGTTVLPGIREAADWMIAGADMRRHEDAHPGRIQRAAEILRRGGIVAFPTETVYGLGAVASNEAAVARVFEAKNRPRFDPLILHVSDLDQVPHLAEDVPHLARRLMERMWPGPLTIVLRRTRAVPDLVTAGLPTVAVRMPRHPLALELIRRTGEPVAAPSANPFGRTSPTTAQHVFDHMEGKLDLVLDGGPCSVGIESTILSFASGAPVLLRPGGTPVEELEAMVGPLATPSEHPPDTVMAPGMLPKHYAPRTRMQIVTGPLEPPRCRPPTPQIPIGWSFPPPACP